MKKVRGELPILKKVKIIYVSLVELEISGGPTVHTLNLVKGLQENGAEVLLVCPKPVGKVDEILPVRCRFVPFFGFSPMRLLLFYFLSFWYLLYDLYTFRPDALYAREMPGNLFLPLVTFFSRRPLFLEVNGPFAFEEGGPKGPSLAQAFMKAVRRFQFNRSKGVTFNSQGLRDTICQQYRYPIHWATVVTMHVDTQRFKPIPQTDCRKQLGISLSDLVMGYVGTFQPTHEVEIMFSALEWFLKRGQKATLILVGGGNQEAYYRDRVLGKPLASHIKFTGWVPHSQIPIYINAFDAGLALLKAPKAYATEAFLKIKEYLACAVPVVINENGKNLFHDYPAGALFFTGTDREDEVGEAILKAAGKRNHPVLQGARDFVREKFSLAHAANRTVAFMIERTAKENEH